MDKSDRISGKQKKTKKSAPTRAGWITLVFFATIVISASFTLLSDALLHGSGIYAALTVLLIIVFIGIGFDVVGVAVTAAEERPLHSMAARKVIGAREAIMLLRNADRVASICNDVVGDICGVVSGAAAAVIAVRVIEEMTVLWPSLLKVGMSAVVAGLTVGGKAVGKGFALRHSVQIVHFVGSLYAAVRRPFANDRKNRRK